MELPLETAYKKLRTTFIRFRIDKDSWTTTHFHEIDKDGDFTASHPDNYEDCILVVDPQTPATIKEDRIVFQAPIDLGDQTVEIQFLEHRPKRNLKKRLLL